MPLITPDLLLQPFANGATPEDVKNPPQTDGDGFVNFTQGYTPFYEISLTANNPQAKAVERQVQNYLFNALTKNAMAWQGQGLPVWYASRPGGYSKESQVIRVVAGVNKIFRSTADDNITDPANSQTWMYVQNTSELINNVPMPAGGAAGYGFELITTATNLNSIGRGTFEFISDAIAQASPNIPVVPGSAAVSGLLEVMTWMAGAQLVTIQRYTDRNSNLFLRSGIDAAMGPWVLQVNVPYLQRGAALLAGASGPANAYVATTTPAFTDFNIGTVLNVYFGGSTTTPNTGPSTLSVNGSPPLPLSGMSGNILQGGEITAGGMAQIRFRGSSWVFCTQYGGSLPIKDATGTRQAASLGQVIQLIDAAKITDVQWSNVKNTPTTLSGYGITDALPNRNAGVGPNYELYGDTYSFLTSGNETHLASNCRWDGANWNRIDTARPASVIVVNQNGPRVQRVAAGANPITWNPAAMFTVCDFGNAYSRVEANSTFAQKATTLSGYGITDAIPNLNNIGPVGFDLHGDQLVMISSANEVYACRNAYWDGSWKQHNPSQPSTAIFINTSGTPGILRAAAGASGSFWNYNQRIMAEDFTYTRNDVDGLLNPIRTTLANKADKATTLAGYGITNGLPNLIPTSGGDYTLLGSSYVFMSAMSIAHMCQNATWNGSQWNRINPALPGIVVMAQNGQLLVQPFAAGPNPLSFPNTYSVINSSNVASEASVGIAPIATQVQVNAGADDFGSVTSKKLRWGVSMSLGPTGFLALPSWLGGVIFNWGRANITQNGQSIAFPKPFPSEVFIFLPGTGNDNSGFAEVMNPVPNSLTVNGVVVNATTATEYPWLAIGR